MLGHFFMRWSRDQGQSWSAERLQVPVRKTKIDLQNECRIIDARPSDSVALALRAEAPIYVTEDVLAEAGGYADDEIEVDEDQPVEDDSPTDPMPSLTSPDIRLEDLDADTFGKYKM